MSQYFLASVGIAEAFKKVDNKLVHYLSARTLSESAINIGVTAEEVRGGPGAQLLGQFFHTSVFGLSMTDTMFKLEYLEAQVGGVIEAGGYGLDKESATVGANGKITMKGVPIELLANTGAMVWYNRPGSTKSKTYIFPIGTTDFSFAIPGAIEGDAYCLNYYANKDNARKLLISAEFVPSELVVFLTTRLYAGDASAPETGKPVGSVTVKIPRFQLNGTTDLAMAMSSAVSVQLAGTALAYEDSCDGAKYAEIVEYIAANPYSDYSSLRVDAETQAVGDTPIVYAVGPTEQPQLVTTGIKFVPASAVDATGKIDASAAGTAVQVTFTYQDKNKVTVTNPDGDVTISGSFEVESTGIPATGISLDATTAVLTVGDTHQIVPTLTPANSTSTVAYTSADVSIATVSASGLVTAVSTGNVTITATAEVGVTATCEITVS